MIDTTNNIQLPPTIDNEQQRWIDYQYNQQRSTRINNEPTKQLG